MRIAFVTPEYVTEKTFDGGLANYLGRVCPLLVQLGHEVDVVVAADNEEILEHQGVRVHRVAVNLTLLGWINRFTLGRLRGSSLWIVQSWLLNRACARLHRNGTLDLIQYASYAATALFRLRQVPAIVRISSYEPLLQDAHDFPYNWDNRLRRRLDIQAIRRADAVFGPSTLMASVVSQAIDRPVQVIESPFFFGDAERDDHPYRDLLDGKEYLLFFGSLSVLKGVPTIAEIISPLLERHPDLFFVFAGKDLGQAGRPMIQRVWDKAGSLRGRVLYLGQMRHTQLLPIVEQAFAVVLPSRIDNLPNSCLEAMACRRVVIGTRGASFEQLIEDGESGFLCPPDAPDQLLAAIEKALSLSGPERKRMGERAALRIDALRSEKTLVQLLVYYRTVIGQKESRPSSP